MDSVNSSSNGQVTIHLHGQSIQLLHDRAIYWPATRSLIVADIHFGKSAAFRRHGLPIPEGDTQGDLERLTRLIQTHKAERLLIAGDLLHAAASKSDSVRSLVEAWRTQHSELSIVLVAGNHDKSAGAIPEEWKIEVCAESLVTPPFVILHDPAAIPRAPEAFYICGHLHPAIALGEGGRSRSLKAPCFWQSKHSLVLPGFGKFTGSVAIRPALGDKIYAITESTVVQVPEPLLKMRRAR